VEGGAKLRKAIYEAKSCGEIVEAVDRFFSRPAVGTEELRGVAGENSFEQCWGQ
jgi:hypothetical protein